MDKTGYEQCSSLKFNVMEIGFGHLNAIALMKTEWFNQSFYIVTFCEHLMLINSDSPTSGIEWNLHIFPKTNARIKPLF